MRWGEWQMFLSPPGCHTQQLRVGCAARLWPGFFAPLLSRRRLSPLLHRCLGPSQDAAMIRVRHHHAHPRLLLLLLLASPASPTEDTDWQVDLEWIVDVAGESPNQLASHRTRPFGHIASRRASAHLIRGPAPASAPGAPCTEMACSPASPTTTHAACVSALPLWPTLPIAAPRAASASASHAMVPGMLQLGDAMLVDGSLCLAKVREVEHAPLRSVQASARLHAWEDRRMLGAWEPQAGCFARLVSDTEASPPLSMPCVPLACGPLAASSCAALGMQSSCIEPEGAWALAVREPLHVAAAARTARLSVAEAAQAMRRLCASPLLGEEEPQRHGAAREVWRAQLGDARGAWRASERDLAAHLRAQLLSVRHGRLVQLGSLVSSLLAEWLDGPALVAALGAWADGLLAFVNASGIGDDGDGGDGGDSAGTGVEAGVEAVARPQWGVLLHQLGLDSPPLAPSPSAAQLELVQLTVETAAQLEAAQLWLHALNTTRQLHMQLGTGCPPASQLASVADYQLSAVNSSLHGWRVALQPLSPKGGALEAAEQCLRHKASEVQRLASGFGTGTAPGLGAGHTGFALCRELHDFAPLLALSLDHESLSADAFGLSHTQAASREGERWLRYHPLAAAIREERGGSQRTYLELRMNSTFDEWPDSSRRRALTWQDQPASGQPAVHPTEEHRSTVPRRAAAPTPLKLAEARRRHLDDCSAGDCSVDMWCDSSLTAVVPVGAGYYSPAGDCARYACTNMDEEYKPTGGGPAYTASGNGSDACPWACGAGWGGVDLPCPMTTRSGFCRRCMAMPPGLWSPATSNGWVTCGCEELGAAGMSVAETLAQCNYGLKAVMRGEAVWTSVRAMPAALARTSANPWPHSDSPPTLTHPLSHRCSYARRRGSPTLSRRAPSSALPWTCTSAPRSQPPRSHPPRSQPPTPR